MYGGTGFGPGLHANLLAAASSFFFAHWSWVFFGPDDVEFSYPGASIIDFVAVAGLGLAALWIAKQTKQRNQANRDRLAATVMDKLREKAPVEHFCLYLRSFDTTSNLAVPPAARSGDLLEELNTDLESFVSKAIFEKYPLIGLGKPGEHIGAGRILTTDADWQEDLKLLADAAMLIFIVPAIDEGVKWELDFLRKNDYFKKSIFIMPSYKSFEKSEANDYWSKIQETFGKMGYEFPQYRKDGMLFLLGSNQRADLAWSLNALSQMLIDFVTFTAEERLNDDVIDAKIAEFKERAASIEDPKLRALLEDLKGPRRWDDLLKEAAERKESERKQGN